MNEPKRKKRDKCVHVERGELEAFAVVRIEPLFVDLGILGRSEVREVCPLCLGYIAGIVLLNRARD